jgi:hypothetical protein
MHAALYLRPVILRPLPCHVLGPHAVLVLIPRVSSFKPPRSDLMFYHRQSVRSRPKQQKWTRAFPRASSAIELCAAGSAMKFSVLSPLVDPLRSSPAFSFDISSIVYPSRWLILLCYQEIGIDAITFQASNLPLRSAGSYSEPRCGFLLGPRRH